MSYRTVMRRVPNHAFEEERLRYQELMTIKRKEHAKAYWDRQTQVENLYLDRFQAERREKQRRDLDRWRTAICNVAMHTKKQITDLRRREAELLERMRRRDLKDTKKAMETRLMLDVMQVDSRRWPTLGDINEKVDANVVLPATILNYGEYQSKL